MGWNSPSDLSKMKTAPERPPVPPRIESLSEIGRAWLEHWWGLPHEGLLPLRSSFDPAAVPKLLPYLEMHDLREPGRSLLRLVGTHVAARYGKDPTGLDYLDFVAPERREEAYLGVLVPASHPCGMRVVMTTYFESGLHTLIEAVGLPMTFDAAGGRIFMFSDMVIGELPHTWTEPGRLTRYELHERQFIDIGAGVPDEQVDTQYSPMPES